ncbi:MAG TPA: DUF4139 domain-containing protein [Kofleriaceae bacterium]|nr:DUF4139 domain-containing protein [Kofleriaceae bacterium]
MTVVAPASIPVIAADLPVVEVVVLEDRARVVRRGAVALPAGQARVTITGVAPVLAGKSLVARAAGVEIVDVRAAREVAPWVEGAPDRRVAAEALVELRARRDQARASVRAAADEAAVARARAAALDDLVTVAVAELAEAAAWGRRADDADARLAELGERARAAHRDATARGVDAERAQAEVTRLDALVAEREREVGRELATVTVDVIATAAATVELTVEYVVPCACWRPYHTATLTGAEVELATDACVWQATGEDWRAVRLRFSTERPSLGTSPPALHDDLLRVQAKGALVVQAREQDIATTGEGAARTVAAEVPGVDDGGQVRLLTAPAPATIPSDGRPYRVRLGSFTAAAEVAHVAMPEKAAAVILRTRQVNAGTDPLLAGPVDLIRDGGLTGRTSILFVAPGERFVLGWGADPAVRVHRAHRDKREEAGVLGSWATTTHRIAIRLSNLGGAARVIEVTERVPVSEVDKVEIKLSPVEAWQLEDDDGERRDKTPLCTEREVDARDGLVTWRVELPARGRRAIALEYVMKVHSSVAGL